MNAHLSDHQLLERLYGAADHAHAESCAQCAARYRELENRRAELAATRPPSPQFLAAQRRKIEQRLQHQTQWRLKWAPAAAAALALAIGLVVYHPVAPKPAPRPDAGDAQLFSEVYSMEQSTEPRAAAPIHALFEDDQ